MIAGGRHVKNCGIRNADRGVTGGERSPARAGDWQRAPAHGILCTIVLVASRALAGGVAWSEDFSTDPIAAGRFSIPAGHDASRFTYHPAAHSLTVHYDTFEPTAWYVRPIDPTNTRTLTGCDDFEFAVNFRIRSAGFFADPNSFAQIGWGLINSASTGPDRAGGSAGPYAFDCVTLDYFPNVSPLYGGPTLGAAVVHSDEGRGFFSAIDFPFGAESEVKAANGDEQILLDTTYTGHVRYSSATQTATLTIQSAGGLLNINVDGGGGPGGADADPTTIQTTLFYPEPFAVDQFALTAWQDTFNPFGSSVIADVDISAVTFFAPGILKGDMNRDGLVDGRDIALFVQTLLAAQPDPCLVGRGDFNGDANATTADISGFQEALLGP